MSNLPEVSPSTVEQTRFKEQKQALESLLGPKIIEIADKWQRILTTNAPPITAETPANEIDALARKNARELFQFISQVVNIKDSEALKPIKVNTVFEGPNGSGKDTVASGMRDKNNGDAPKTQETREQRDSQYKEPPPMTLTELRRLLGLSPCLEATLQECEALTVRQILKGQKELPSTEQRLTHPVLQMLLFTLSRIAFTQSLRQKGDEAQQAVIVRNFVSTMVYQASTLAYLAWAKHHFNGESPNIPELPLEQSLVFENYLRYYQQLIAHLHILLMRENLLYIPKRIVILYPAQNVISIVPRDYHDYLSGPLPEDAPIYVKIQNAWQEYYGKYTDNTLNNNLHMIMLLAQQLANQIQNASSQAQHTVHLAEGDRIDHFETDKKSTEALIYMYAALTLKTLLQGVPLNGIDIKVLEALAFKFAKVQIDAMQEEHGEQFHQAFSEKLANAFEECCPMTNN